MKLNPKESYPNISGKWRSIDEIELETASIGTIIRFWGSHPDSRYLMQIIQEEDKRFTKLWFKERDGCVQMPVSNWKCPQYNINFKVGCGYVVPHFYYDENGLTERGLREPRAEGFKLINILENN